MKRLVPTLVLLPALLLGALPASGGLANVNGRIAFERSRNRPLVTEVWTMNQDGSGQRLIGVGEDPDWSPDGKQIAYGRGRDLILVRPDVGDERRVPTSLDLPYPYRVHNPDWSPDGTRLAFAVGGAIYDISAAGGTARKLLESPADDIAPAWSPDGSKIAFVTGGAVWVMNADGSGRRPLAGTRVPSHNGANRGVAWSPDGAALVYGDSTGGMSIVGLDGVEPVRIVPFLGWDHAGNPSWSPDGKRLAFVHNGVDICAVNADGSGVGRLTYAPFDSRRDEHLYFNRDPDWQPLPEGSVPAGPTTYRIGPDRSWNRNHGWSFACSRNVLGRSLTASATPRRAGVGSVVTYRIRLENQGRLPLGEFVSFGATFDGGLRLLSVSPTQGRCGWEGHIDRGSPEYHVECDFGSLFPGERATATVRVRANTPGELVLGAALIQPAEDDDVIVVPGPPLPLDVLRRTRVRGCTRLGTQSADLLTGSAGHDVLCGLDGDDRLRPGRGRDLVLGGRGNDSVDSRDGYVDEVICGSGLDSVVADSFDRVGRHCENVTRR